MTISNYSNAIVDTMLGWLKGLANWVLRLFNLAGSVSTSPLLWLSHNWLKLLIFFLALGIIVDRVIWLIRWRPYWVWFRKERVIVNDERIFTSADIDRAGDRERDLDENWDEHDYVVASTVVKRQNRERPAEPGMRAGEGHTTPRRRTQGTRVRRHAASSTAPARRRRPETEAAGRRTARRGEPVPVRRRKPEAAVDSLFAIDPDKPDSSDFYEDEVFNVSSLPAFDEYPPEDGDK